MSSSIRVGDMLVHAGVITPGQLGAALRQQAHAGGRLGTNLVQLGIIDEPTLASFLAQQLHIPAANAAQIDRVPAAVLRYLSAALAVRLRAIPVREDGGKLWIAMADPTDRATVDELERLCGRSVRVMVAPELLIQRALEQHYQVRPRPPRAPIAAAADFAVQDRAGAARGGAVAPAPGAASAPLFEEGRGDRIDEAAMTGFLDDAVAVKPPEVVRMDLAEVRRQLCAPLDDGALLTAAMRFALQDAARGGIFVLRAGALVGWTGMGLEAAALQEATAPLDELARLMQLLARGRAFIGQLSLELLGPLAPVLGLRAETLGVILPATIDGHLVGCIIGVEGTLDLLRQQDAFDQLVVALDRALARQGPPPR